MAKTSKSPITGRGKRNVRMRSPEQVLMNSRFVMMLREARWVLYLIAGLSLAVMLFTWHATDPGWVSTSGSGEIQNAFGAFVTPQKLDHRSVLHHVKVVNNFLLF